MILPKLWIINIYHKVGCGFFEEQRLNLILQRCVSLQQIYIPDFGCYPKATVKRRAL